MAAIIILNSDTSNGNLTLKDGNECHVSKNEVVTWQINPNSGVELIIAIPPKKGSPNVFASGPAPLGSSKNWQGRIRNDLKVTTEEEYDIKWKDGAGKEYTFDPKIKVNV